MKQIIITLVCLILQRILLTESTFPPETCGRTKWVSSKIVGGNETTPGKWPWLVFLLKVTSNSGFEQHCGGMLLSNRWVLSAAHCTINLTPANLRVVLGEHNIQEEEYHAMDHAVSEIINHPGYNDDDDDLLLNDISLIKLAGEAKYSDFIHPICLPDQGQRVNTGVLCWISGWGNTLSQSESGNILRDAIVPVLATSNCFETFSTLQDQHLCAGNKDGGVDTCQGDSGGPLFCRDPSTSLYVARGITSFGIGCTGHGIYTRVSEFVDWIKETINNSSDYHEFFSIPQKPCGSFIKEDEVFRLPVNNYTQLYHPNSTCTWIVRPNANVTRVFLTFVERFAVESGSSSCLDYLEVSTGNGTLIRTDICGHDIPKGFFLLPAASDRDFRVTFFSDGSKHFEGFAINVTFYYQNVTAPNCATTFIKVIGSETRTISTPGYPYSTIANNLDCYYQLEADPGYKIFLRIQFDLELCDYVCDYVEVYDGTISLGKLIGYAYDKVVLSTGNIVGLRLVTDFSKHSYGFKADYFQIKSTCGEDLTATSEVQNFEYSSTTTTTTKLPPSASTSSLLDISNVRACYWSIKTSMANHVIAIVVYELQISFEDSLKIIDGFDMLVEYAENTYDYGSVSHTNKVQIMLQSDFGGDITFRAGYFITELCAKQQVIELAGDSFDVITSPGYPLASARGLNCEYIFQAQPNRIIELQLEGDLKPCCDYILVYDNDNYNEIFYSLLENISIISDYSSIILKYGTAIFNNYNGTNGFKATYRQFNNSCGGRLTARATPAYITSPNYPSAYQNGNCYWLITSSSDQDVEFVLLDLNLSSGDKLVVNINQEYSRTFTGSINIQQSLISLDNFLRVAFTTDNNGVVGGTGFEASYTLLTPEEICGETFFNLSGNNVGVLTSPNYPQPSPNNLNCSYEFRAASGFQIEIKLSVDTEICCDYVEVFEGRTKLLRLNGVVSNATILSTLNQLTLLYFTDRTLNSNGFQMKYREFKALCGETLQASDIPQTFSSPISLVSNNIDEYCLWVVKGISDKQLYLTITSDNLQSDTFRLEIVNDQFNSIQITKSSSFPFVTSFSTSRFTIKFYKYSNATSGGFKATYSSLGICGITNFNLSGSAPGVMSSPNYPYNSPNDLTCSYEFHAEPGYRINMTLEGRTEACCDYIEIYDGSRHWGKLSGDIPPTTFLSSREYLRIDYYTDYSVTLEGFRAEYQPIMLTCGSNLIASRENQTITFSGQSIVSSSIPCIWFIIAPIDNQIILNIHNIEDGVVTVLIGLTTSTTLTNSSNKPFEVVSENGLLQIQYTVIEMTSNSGFTASYFSIDKCSNVCDLVGGTCDLDSTFGFGDCTCKNGYSGNGYNCSDVDECMEKEALDSCHANATCINNVGSYDCTCNVGYAGDGQYCNAVVNISATLNPAFQYTPDLQNKSSEAYMSLSRLVTEQLEMKLENVRVFDVSFYKGSVVFVASLELLNNSTVQAVLDSFNNTIGDTSLFETLPSTDFDPCTFDPCGLNEVCRNISTTTHTCACSEGYINSTGKCELITCNDCSTFASCNSNATLAQCVCKPGFTGDGLVCDDIDECSTYSDPCPNAVCINYAGTFECQCNPETYKKNGVCTPQCEIGYCLNGATCIERNFVGTPACLCMEGYTGETCGEKIEEDPGKWIAIGVLAGVVFILLVMVMVMMMKLRRNS